MYKLVTIQSGTLGVDESNRPSSRPNPPQKQGKGASESSTSKVRISLIFRAPEARIYEKVPILQVTFLSLSQILCWRETMLTLQLRLSLARPRFSQNGILSSASTRMEKLFQRRFQYATKDISHSSFISSPWSR